MVEISGESPLSASHDGTVRVWDVESGQCLCVLEGHGACVVNAAWTLDPDVILSCDSTGGLRRWHWRVNRDVV